MSALIENGTEADRRVRHQVRDGLAVVAVSAGGSGLFALLLMVLVRLLTRGGA